MNERIKELANQAVGKRSCYMIEAEYIKFAELIVRECARRSYLEDSGNSEVEEALEFWRKDMLKHFGVEE